MKDFLLRNRVALLVAAVVGAQLVTAVGQILTWRAVVLANNEISIVSSAIIQTSCGGSGMYDRACRVVVIPP